MKAKSSGTAQAMKLLQLRRDRVETARSALAQADADVAGIQGRIDRALRAMAEHNVAASNALARKEPSAVLGVYRRCVDDLQAAAAAERARIGQAALDAHRWRRELTEALADLKAARQFKQRRDSQDLQEARRAETLEGDDLHRARESIRRRGS